MCSDYYKIYVHDSSRNDTLKAIQAAYANCDRPMVLFIGTPYDDRLANDWKKLDTPKFRKFLANEHIVCLKVEDSDKHCKRLARDSRKRINPDGSRHAGEIVLIKPSMVLAPSGFDLPFDFNSHCYDFISGYGKKDVTAAGVIRWLEESQELDCYKQAFPYFSSHECEPDAVEPDALQKPFGNGRSIILTDAVQPNALQKPSGNGRSIILTDSTGPKSGLLPDRNRRWTVLVKLDSGEVAAALRNLVDTQLRDAGVDAEVILQDDAE